MRHLNFITELDDAAINEVKKLNKHIEESISDDEFIFESCHSLINGGKRLRPILFLICSKSKGKNNFEKNLPLATAIELIHTASLVHDDILDESKIRRGVRTINSKYGAQIAVLIGDYLFAKAFELVAQNHYGDEVSEVLSKLVKNLCVGEITQDRSLFKIPTLEEYYQKIYLKTAVFLGSCCRIGAIVAQLNKNEIESLTNYGINLGLAFQIVDDLLDFYGDVQSTGKALGGDFKSGVITLPIIRALKVSDHSNELKKIVTHKNINENEIEQAIEIIKSTDALEYCKSRAKAHIESARINLPNEIEETTNFLLDKISDFVIDRTW